MTQTDHTILKLIFSYYPLLEYDYENNLIYCPLLNTYFNHSIRIINSSKCSYLVTFSDDVKSSGLSSTIRFSFNINRFDEIVSARCYIGSFVLCDQFYHKLFQLNVLVTGMPHLYNSYDEEIMIKKRSWTIENIINN